MRSSARLTKECPHLPGSFADWSIRVPMSSMRRASFAFAPPLPARCSPLSARLRDPPAEAVGHLVQALVERLRLGVPAHLIRAHAKARQRRLGLGPTRPDAPLRSIRGQPRLPFLRDPHVRRHPGLVVGYEVQGMT